MKKLSKKIIEENIKHEKKKKKKLKETKRIHNLN